MRQNNYLYARDDGSVIVGDMVDARLEYQTGIDFTDGQFLTFTPQF